MSKISRYKVEMWFSDNVGGGAVLAEIGKAVPGGRVVIQPVPSEFDSHYLSSRLKVLESNTALQQLFHHEAPMCSMPGPRQAGDPCS
jgi:hypothetical protein